LNAQDVRSPGKRVLVVDDSADTARMMKVLLKRHGFEARIANDGDEALAVATSFLPDILLLDLVLPGLSGQEVAAEVRKQPALAGARIVAVSGYGHQGIPPHFDDLIVKPVDHEALLRLLSGARPEPAATLTSPGALTADV
jgi:CheY-like chemotaxis protein